MVTGKIDTERGNMLAILHYGGQQPVGHVWGEVFRFELGAVHEKGVVLDISCARCADRQDHHFDASVPEQGDGWI